MSEVGIHVNDVKSDNFRGGLIVDLGSAWTTPHIMFQFHKLDDLKRCQERELDEMFSVTKGMDSGS